MGNWRQSGVGGVLMTAFAALMVPVTAICILLAAPFLGPRRAFFRVAPLFAHAVSWFCAIPFELQGWERMPADICEGRQPVIFMANHESQLDPPMLAATLPLPAVYIGKRELKYVPFIGWAAWCAGVIFIDRGDRERAIRSIHDAALQIRGGKNVVIFPEGTRTRTGELLPFKKGGFALALDSGVPIVPVAAVGGYQILPAGGRRMRPGPFVVRVGEPVSPEAFPDREQLSGEVRRRVAALIAEVRAQQA